MTKIPNRLEYLQLVKKQKQAINKKLSSEDYLKLRKHSSGAIDYLNLCINQRYIDLIGKEN